MSQKIIVTADSTCSLGKELCERYHVPLAPLHVVFPDGDFLDGVDIDSQIIFDIKEEKGVLPKTSAVNVGEYLDFFKPYLDEGYEILHVNLGSGISSCYQNCLLAAEEDGRIHPIDSGSLSTGSGLMVLDLCDRVAAGQSVEEILKDVDSIRAHISASFLIDTLEYLYKGGRCSALEMLGANLLKLKPCIEVDPRNGSMNVGKKYRGQMEKALCDYVRDRLMGRTDLDTRRIFITHSPFAGMPDTTETVRAEIQKYAQFDEILVTDSGCTIASHCGPATLGILFMTK